MSQDTVFMPAREDYCFWSVCEIRYNVEELHLLGREGGGHRVSCIYEP